MAKFDPTPLAGAYLFGNLGKSPKPVFIPKLRETSSGKTEVGKKIEQMQTEQLVRPLTGVMGLFLGPGGRELATETLRPWVKPLTYVLNLFGANPYTSTATDVYRALALAKGRISRPEFEQGFKALIKAFEHPQIPGLTRRETETPNLAVAAATAREAAKRGLISGLAPKDIRTIMWLRKALSPIERTFGISDPAKSIQVLEKLIGNLSSYSNPQNWVLYSYLALRQASLGGL